MSDQPDTTAGLPPAVPKIRPPRRGLILAIGVAVVMGCVGAVLYGMVPLGKETAACPAAAAATARLDPLIHGEVAAFGLARPAREAPDLTFAGPDSRPVTMAALKGRTLLLNVWATWCVPCRKEMPALDRLQGMLGGTDFEVVAVNVDTARLDRPAAFLKEAGITHLAAYADASGEVLQVLKQQGGLLGLPTSLLIDRNGCELGRIAGPAAWDSPEATALIAAARG